MTILTPFGRLSRQLRQDRGLLLGDVADRLRVTSSYLSQMETGTKIIPDGMAEKIADVMSLSASERRQMLEAAALSAKAFKITMPKAASDLDRELAHRFVTEFARMPAARKQRILRTVQGG